MEPMRPGPGRAAVTVRVRVSRGKEAAMASRMKNTVVSGLALLFLVGAAADRAANMVAPEDTAPYQARVREAYAQLPMRMGDWVGEDTPVPQAAITLLRPNVILSRRYTNFVTGRTASVLLTQCADARDMAGHYPPICYPNQGWILQGRELHQWSVDNLMIDGTTYRFLRSPQSPAGIAVRNFMMLPDGSTAADMDAVRKSTSVRRRFYGAGQVQVICDAGVPEQEQDEIFASLVRGHVPLINTVLAGLQDHQAASNSRQMP